MNRSAKFLEVRAAYTKLDTSLLEKNGKTDSVDMLIRYDTIP